MEYYHRCRLIQDYISGMTDLYAWDEYRRLMAVE
jgi:dGTPase